MALTVKQIGQQDSIEGSGDGLLRQIGLPDGDSCPADAPLQRAVAESSNRDHVIGHPIGDGDHSIHLVHDSGIRRIRCTGGPIVNVEGVVIAVINPLGPTLQRLKAYCEFIDSEQSYVIREMLNLVLDGDPVFVEWHSSRQQQNSLSQVRSKL